MGVLDEAIVRMELFGLNVWQDGVVEAILLYDSQTRGIERLDGACDEDGSDMIRLFSRGNGYKVRTRDVSEKYRSENGETHTVKTSEVRERAEVGKEQRGVYGGCQEQR